MEKIGLLFLGGAITYLFQQYRIDTSEELSQVNEHIKDIEKFAELAEKYWTQTFEDYQADRAFAAKVTAAHALAVKLYEQVKFYCAGVEFEYTEQLRKLYKLSTGGRFNTKGRPADVERAAEILETANELIHLLRMSRSRIISLERLIARILRAIFVQSSEPWLKDRPSRGDKESHGRT